MFSMRDWNWKSKLQGVEDWRGIRGLNRRWLLAVFTLCLVVLYIVLRPEPPPRLFPGSDKVGHVLGLFLLCLIGRLAFPRIAGWAFWPLFFAAAPFLEWLQDVLQPRRVYDVDDALANVIGVCAALFCWGVFRLYGATFGGSR